MAAAIALGFRHPWAWSFVLLTKVTPDPYSRGSPCVASGGRSAPRSGSPGSSSPVSFAVDSDAWRSWIEDSLGATASGAPLNQFAIPVPLWVACLLPS